MFLFQIVFRTLRTVLTTTMRTFIVIHMIFRSVHWANGLIVLRVALATNTGRAFRAPGQHQCNDCTEKEKREHTNCKASRNAGHP
jgi:hypothetical protein